MTGTTARLSLVHLRTAEGDRWAVRTDGVDRPLPMGLDELLALPRDQARAIVDAAAGADPQHGDTVQGDLLPPIGTQEVWAAGVTYERSRDGRVAESTEADVYTRVYGARRPELFFKATASRVVGDGQPVGVRVDSPWNAPEAELGLVVDASGAIFGFVVGNDVSSRSIEGENPLYLPQAKVYTRACALGPGIVPVWAAPEQPFGIDLTVERAGATAFEGSTSTASLARPLEDLVAWLTAALDFSVGAVLLTGTGIVPDESFDLKAGDVVTITIDGIGTLVNPVVQVGRPIGPR
jgi:2-dehydro-3-deoxy-D-arabinonate dehydratase